MLTEREAMAKLAELAEQMVAIAGGRMGLVMNFVVEAGDAWRSRLADAQRDQNVAHDLELVGRVASHL